MGTVDRLDEMVSGGKCMATPSPYLFSPSIPLKWVRSREVSQGRCKVSQTNDLSIKVFGLWQVTTTQWLVADARSGRSSPYASILRACENWNAKFLRERSCLNTVCCETFEGRGAQGLDKVSFLPGSQSRVARWTGAGRLALDPTLCDKTAHEWGIRDSARFREPSWFG